MQIKMEKLLLGLFFVLTLAGCKDNSGVEWQEEDALELSEKGNIVVPASTSKLEITVSTASGKWEVINTGSEWIKSEKTPSSLRLEISENPTSASRKAELLFLSGKMSQKLVLTQEGSGNVFHLSSDKIEFPWWNERSILSLDASGAEWHASTEASWLHLTEIPSSGRLMVESEDNPTFEYRRANVHLSTADGTASQIITVTQSGRIDYILPYMEFLTTSLQVQDFEFARYSGLIGAPNGMFNKTVWTFTTDSEVFTRISYTIYDESSDELDASKQFYKRSQVIANDGNLFQDKHAREGAIRFLGTQGFIYDDETGTMRNYEKGVRAELVHSDGFSAIQFTCDPKQPQAYATFEALPTAHFEVTNKAEMEAFEEAHGGVLDTERSKLSGSNFLYYYRHKEGGTSKKPIWHLYSINEKGNGTLEFLNYFYESKSTALFEYGKSDFLTDEFLDKMKSLGFEYNNEITHKRFEFVNVKEGLKCYVRWIWYVGFTGPMLEVQIQH